MSAAAETAFVFDCHGDQLPAILHAGHAEVGVVIVVGGPQYRVGSHRQFVLLARHLAAQGYPVLRFDYRGMGDASGDYRGFEAITPDIEAAVDAFLARQPGVRRVVLWGLCDAASAALFYAARDARITGLVLLNPWVRTDTGEARAYLGHYYRDRLADPAAWKALLRRPVRLLASLGSLAGLLRRAAARGDEGGDQQTLPERMLAGLEAFRGRVLLITSGRDLTAAEFLDAVQRSPRWQRALADDRVSRLELSEANHTFASAAQRQRVAEATAEWLAGDDAERAHG